MSILNNSLLLGADAGGYQISRSLRFNSADSAYLSRTPASAGNRKTWTFSLWVKRSAIGTNNELFTAGTDVVNGPAAQIALRTGSDIRWTSYSGAFQLQLITTQVFRDPSAWYHLLFSVDTTQATAANRARIFVNGAQVTTFSTETYPSQNTDLLWNQAALQGIATNITAAGASCFDGYLADIHFIDGQALTPSSFGETNATTGQWVPKAYTGTYGTNGFRLDFSDNSAATATTLGKDRAGSNNWTPNNLSVTAGAGNDSLVDTPTSYGTDTGAGGEVRGNYCTWNPVDSGTTEVITNGNLDVKTNVSATYTSTRASFGVSSGKWYWEVTCNAPSPTASDQLGIGTAAAPINNYFVKTSDGYGYQQSSGQKWTNDGGSAYGASYTTNDVIGVALNMDAGTVVFYKNGASQGTAFSSLSGTFFPMIFIRDTTGSYSANFGQRPFAYTAPSGFKALCDTNLPAPVVAKPSTVMDVVTYTGTGASRSITGLNFSPDWVWIKSRSNGAYHHRLVDTVRGATKEIYSNLTNAEGTDPVGLTAFNSDGFTLGSSNEYNASGQTFVGWVWDAGSTTVTNTQGSITSQVRANASAGFSIVTYTGNGTAGATIGHGLGVTPAMLIIKSRSRSTNDWKVWLSSFANTESLLLNSTGAKLTGQTAFLNSTTPTSSVITLGTDSDVNFNAATYVAYCFAPVAGYSSFGSYTGNGSTDGPFVYTGFRPRWVMFKSSSSATDWVVEDVARSTYNVIDARLFPNTSDAELSNGNGNVDYCSNGFKLRNSHAAMNSSGATYVWTAFAESPFAYSRAR